jgi:hypothetical protein
MDTRKQLHLPSFLKSLARWDCRPQGELPGLVLAEAAWGVWSPLRATCGGRGREASMVGNEGPHQGLKRRLYT